MTRTQRNDGLTYWEQDAIQDVIKELRLEIASLTRGNETLHKLIDEQLAEIANLKAGGCARNQGSTQFCAEAVDVGEKLGAMQRHVELCRQIVKCPDDETLAEWLKGFVRLDDPVVTGSVEALNRLVLIYESEYDEPPMRPGWLRNPLSAYEARVKEVGK